MNYQSKLDELEARWAAERHADRAAVERVMAMLEQGKLTLADLSPGNPNPEVFHVKTSSLKVSKFTRLSPEKKSVLHLVQEAVKDLPAGFTRGDILNHIKTHWDPHVSRDSVSTTVGRLEEKQLIELMEEGQGRSGAKYRLKEDV